jgi:hypothetical protein
LSRAATGIRLGPVTAGLLVTGVLILLHVLWERGFGHLRQLPPSSTELGEVTTSRVIEVLTGFIVGAGVALRRYGLRDLERLRPYLVCAPGEYDAFVEGFRRMPRLPAAAASLAALALGLLVVPDEGTGLPFLLSDQAWSHAMVWALLANAILFPILGYRVYETFSRERVVRRLEARLGEVDLLDLRPLAFFARRGLRGAFFWLVGSSIASLIYVNIGFHWATGAVIVGTVSVGTAAFLLPMRGVHQRIRNAKSAELERVRAAIRAARAPVLEGAEKADAASLRLPALLAYEARIEQVREWPFDTPTLTRFSLLVLLAVGSWLGGAVVELLLDIALE